MREVEMGSWEEGKLTCSSTQSSGSRQAAEGAALLLDLFSGAAAQAAGDQFLWRRRDPRSR
jgi:hypothetical protein